MQMQRGWNGFLASKKIDWTGSWDFSFINSLFFYARLKFTDGGRIRGISISKSFYNNRACESERHHTRTGPLIMEMKLDISSRQSYF